MHRRSFLAASAGLAAATAADAATPGNQPRAGVDYRGRPRAEIPTPALLLDLAAFEANLKSMADHCKKAGFGFRPHAKTHKCPEIYHRRRRSDIMYHYRCWHSESALPKGIVVASEWRRMDCLYCPHLRRILVDALA